MATLEVPLKVAQTGVGVMTGQSTTIVVRLATIEILVGGPYTKDGKEHTYGHAALRVVTSEGERVYDFGRYGDVTGEFGAEGEGILRVWTRFDPYISGENALGRTTTGFMYETAEEKAREVNQHFERIVSTGTLRRVRPPGSASPVMREYVLPQNYHALSRNCTTMTLDGAQVALPRIEDNAARFNTGRGMSTSERMAARARGLGSWPSRIFMPADVRLMLEAHAVHKPKQVRTFGGS